MSFYIPTIKKMYFVSDILIERIMPVEGQINVQPHSLVDPSTNLATCKISYEVINLGQKFIPSKKNITSFNQGDLVGKVHKNKFIAPFKGSLYQLENNYYFKSEEKDNWLLAGVWGEVLETSHNRSVLLKTQGMNIHVPICTPKIKSGELIVFPNPEKNLVLKYLENYVKTSIGKIIYVGNKITIDIVKKAAELKIDVILGGSADLEVYTFAKANDIGLGLFSIIGNANTPNNIFNFINEITNRYVFFYGDRGVLQIPMPAVKPEIKVKKVSNATKSSNLINQPFLKFVKKGLEVQIFEYDHFGKIGVVDRVGKSGILVRLYDGDEIVSVLPPNLVACE
ncbi:hypothetical protein A2V49_00325 [candidate division WWE3 bacterium RBG_19FT_COMBO_34_6]|uniref:Uncharacterized protein n=1 Tax=candidate division WWE3 bacterium RBG_19FT_COMBO_34_6 TaxID=1802612 RepID=A0A1F4UN13_UNCKA|nr:MAG: hypothetical protein A2V49_00325 [candidate division WWE3 bacterium RBG_19FT_COMBO_34_6]